MKACKVYLVSVIVEVTNAARSIVVYTMSDAVRLTIGLTCQWTINGAGSQPIVWQTAADPWYSFAGMIKGNTSQWHHAKRALLAAGRITLP